MQSLLIQLAVVRLLLRPSLNATLSKPQQLLAYAKKWQSAHNLTWRELRSTWTPSFAGPALQPSAAMPATFVTQSP